MKRKIISILMISVMALTGWGCGSSDSIDSTEAVDVQKIIQEANSDVSEDGKTIINIYAQYADDDTMVPYDYAAEKLKETYPDVELNLVIQSPDDGATIKLLEQTGQLPDIFQANTSVITALKESGDILELSSIAESSGYLNKLYDSCKELTYDSDGKIYCLPYAGNEYVLWYYNKDLFEQCGLTVPTTYDELMNCVKVFKAHGIIPVSTWSEGWINAAMYDVFATNYVSSGIYGLDTGATSISDEEEIVAEIPVMMQKLSNTIPLMTSTTKFSWGLSNQTLTDSLLEAANAMIAGKVTGSEMISQIKQ